MRVGIVSDTHSRRLTVAKVLEVLRDRRVEYVLHCGDIEDAETVRMFRDIPTHFVLGNCDSDSAELRLAVHETGATLQEPFGSVELGGRKIAWIHGDDPRLLRDIEHSGYFDYLFYGHTHHAEQHWTGPTLVVNPGALHRAREKTFAVLDSARGEIETIKVEG